MSKKDAYSIIKKELSLGPKTPEELRLACNKEGVIDSTYYYHLKQLIVKLHEVEEISEKDGKGRLVKKYALVEPREEKKEVLSWIHDYGGVVGFRAGDLEVGYPPSRSLLELAAWIKYDPANWDKTDVQVRRANLCLEHCRNLVPIIGQTREDPDKYVFLWSDDAVGKVKLDDAPFS